MPPLDTILFDMGGTLDGRGGWRERSRRLFLEAGLDHFSHAQQMAAFDYADAQSQRAGEMKGAGLRDMLRWHIGWQLESLGVDDLDLVRRLVDRFACGAEQAAAVNRRVLATLKERGYRLGLVSNACGNVAALCDEFGYSASLSVVVDSHWFGRSKPDPAIFTHALALVDSTAERTGFVGDSLDHDIRPAKRLGMTTFWIANRGADAAGAADFVLDGVADLPDRLPL
jgi:HAD superfamily hydrolase (TIGR01509 family)